MSLPISVWACHAFCPRQPVESGFKYRAAGKGKWGGSSNASAFEMRRVVLLCYYVSRSTQWQNRWGVCCRVLPTQPLCCNMPPCVILEWLAGLSVRLILLRPSEILTCTFTNSVCWIRGGWLSKFALCRQPQCYCKWYAQCATLQYTPTVLCNRGGDASSSW